MATLYITEFTSASMAGLGSITNSYPIPAPSVDTINAEQHVQISASSVLSNPFNDLTTFVMVNCDAACSLAWGPTTAAPVAVATSQRLGANETRFYGVPKGKKWEVAVIQNS